MDRFSGVETDYTFFFFGLAWLLLAGAALLLRGQTERLRWPWLALFGVGCAVHQWLQMLTEGRPDAAAAHILQLAFGLTAFLALLEFGRAWQRPDGRRLGAWL